MNDKPSPAPGPYDWTCSDKPGGSGVFNIYVVDANDRKIAAVWGKDGEKQATADLFISASRVPGVVRKDEEGNDKTYEHEAVTMYWLKHYCTGPTCDMCGNHGTFEGERGPVYCICPNGQVLRWNSIER